MYCLCGFQNEKYKFFKKRRKQEYTFEVGGKNKQQHQISGLKNAFIVKDNIEFGAKNIIPLWLFGLIY